ncbi:MAG: WD40 repeat domain-containing protein [Hyphomicrobiales bacterium]|jgi:WD40 repeat protein|nr:WD40 repeat domain-containing protein [Hyphomicrobiales bacterium]
MNVTAPASLTQHVAAIEAGEHVIAAAWLGQVPALALSDGAVMVGAQGDQSRVEVHGSGGLLAAVAAGGHLFTGGCDGRVCSIDAHGQMKELARDAKGGWIDAIAATPAGAVAFSVGKRVTARDEKGGLKQCEAPSTAQGLAFTPKGYRLVIAHYNGATLWFPNTSTPTQLLAWKGAHLDATVSPDGRFVVTSMQENALHGWRLPAKPTDEVAHMRMSGYPAKTRSFSWSHDGNWLATSGAEAVIIWPFQGDGPMGKAPRECGVRRAKVTQVAFHPGAYVIAAGYEDGCILLLRLTDGSELLARPAVKGSGITALCWNKPGKSLLFGCADGQAGLLTLPA